MPGDFRIILESNASEVGKKFEEYCQYNLRDVKELMRRKARSMGYSLYKATPTAKLSDIRAKVKALGWAVHRKFRVKRKKGESVQQSLERMQNSIIAARFASAKFEASGWLPAVQKSGKAADQPPVKVSNPNMRGSAQIKISDTECYIEIVNSTPGIVTLEEARPFLAEAIEMEIADMNEYIERKQKERATIFNPSGKV